MTKFPLPEGVSYAIGHGQLAQSAQFTPEPGRWCAAMTRTDEADDGTYAWFLFAPDGAIAMAGETTDDPYSRIGRLVTALNAVLPNARTKGITGPDADALAESTPYTVTSLPAVFIGPGVIDEPGLVVRLEHEREDPITVCVAWCLSRLPRKVFDPEGACDDVEWARLQDLARRRAAPAVQAGDGGYELQFIRKGDVVATLTEEGLRCLVDEENPKLRTVGYTMARSGSDARPRPAGTYVDHDYWQYDADEKRDACQVPLGGNEQCGYPKAMHPQPVDPLAGPIRDVLDTACPTCGRVGAHMPACTAAFPGQPS